MSVRDDIAVPGSKVTGPAASLRYHNQRAGESSVFINELCELSVMVGNRSILINELEF